MNTTVDEILEHHGVKGMKWGIRKADILKGKSKTSSITSEDHRRLAEFRRQHHSTLSNEQLRQINERLQLEQKFRQLNPSRVEAGRKRAAAILATIGLGVTAHSYFKSPAAKALIQAGKKTFKK